VHYLLDSGFRGSRELEPILDWTGNHEPIAGRGQILRWSFAAPSGLMTMQAPPQNRLQARSHVAHSRKKRRALRQPPRSPIRLAGFDLRSPAARGAQRPAAVYIPLTTLPHDRTCVIQTIYICRTRPTSAEGAAIPCAHRQGRKGTAKGHFDPGRGTATPGLRPFQGRTPRGFPAIPGCAARSGANGCHPSGMFRLLSQGWNGKSLGRGRAQHAAGCHIRHPQSYIQHSLSVRCASAGCRCRSAGGSCRWGGWCWPGVGSCRGPAVRRRGFAFRR